MAESNSKTRGPEKRAQSARRCSGKTKTGASCKSTALIAETGTCMAHAPEQFKASRGFGGPENGARGGRPRKPRVIDIYRQKVEAEAEEWWRVLVEARSAERGVVVGDGEHARVEYVEDHPTRLKAFKEAMDRVYGKPMQYVDLTGRADESEIDREISELLAEMDRRDPALAEVARANGKARA